MLKLKKGNFYLIVFLLLLSNILNSQQIAITAAIEQEIDQIFNDYEDKAGCAVGIFQDGKIVFQKNYGYSNLEDEVKVSSNSIFELASISKQFTAACILLLEEEGKLSLDDSIEKYLPELPKFEGEKVSIRHLLHHTSGLRDYLVIMHVKGDSWNSNFTEEDGLEILKRQKKLRFTPGERYSYSNSNYLALALIVQRVSGVSLDTYAQKNIFQPLGMTNTFFYDDSGRVIKNRAIGYTDQGDGYERDHYFNFIVPGDVGLHTNIQDFLKWSNNFSLSKIGGSNFVEKMLKRSVLNNGQTHTYALGVEHGELVGENFFAHNGSWGGSRSMFIQVPEQQLAIIAMSNNGTINVWSKTYEAIRILLNDQQAVSESEGTTAVAPATRNYIQLSKQQKEQFCWDYIDKTSGYARKIYLENDTLRYGRSDGSSSRLLPISENEFEMEASVGLIVSFETMKGKKMMLLRVNDGPPMYEYEGFVPKEYTTSEWTNFTGKYFSEELNQEYLLELEDDSILFKVKGETLEPFWAATEDFFYSSHLGHMQFSRDKSGKITQFLLTDDGLGEVIFEKL